MPEIRYKDIAIIDNLLPVQYNILANAAKYVKSGGTLVYSTCTLSRAENEGVARNSSVMTRSSAKYLLIRLFRPKTAVTASSLQYSGEFDFE